MLIWILNQYALKPTDSGGTRHYEFSREFRRRGHQVRIFASSFLHYKFCWRGERKNYEEDVHGIRYTWLWTLPYRGNGLKRMLNMASFFFMVLFKGLLHKEKPDVIIGSSVHPFTCVAAYYLSRWKKAVYLVEIRDLWPQVLIDFGVIGKDSLPARFLRAVERFIYKRADQIVVLQPGNVDYIAGLGIPRHKVHVIPQGISMATKETVGQPAALREKLLAIRQKHGKIAMYMGAHGFANALELLVESAAYLDPSEAALVFIGEGPEKERLQQLAAGMDHVYFFSSIPKQEVYATLYLADVLLVSFARTEKKFGISPNKLNDYLLIGKPVLFSGTVQDDIVTAAGAGETIETDDRETYAAALKRLLALDEEQRAEIERSSYRYVEQHHNIEHLAERFLQLCQRNASSLPEGGEHHEATV